MEPADFQHSRAVLQERLAAIVESSDDAIVSKNLQGIIQSWNSAAERTFGYSAEEVIGKSILLIVPPERAGEEHDILSRLRRGERVEHFETVRVRKDGRRIDISVTISPIRDETGAIVGASKVARDITGLKQTEREKQQLLERERAARTEAETANRLKDEFLATLSHELRTPLNAILGWSQLLVRDDSLTEKARKGVETIERNARLQAKLIEELLDMSRIIAGKLRLDMQRVELPVVVINALETARPSAQNKQIELVADFGDNVPEVMGDPSRLHQIIWNLLTNAIKFTPAGGRVGVSLRREHGKAQIIVTDTGMGIRPEFLSHVFSRFSQADSSSKRRHGGLGIGLAIVRHLTEMHGGTVAAASEGEGLGATFTISLPTAVSRSSTADAAGAVSAVLTRETSTQGAPLRGVKVLVVDDEPDARAVVCAMLESAGATVFCAESAAEGLRILQRERPDVLLSDIAMPEQDGYEFIRQVRRLASSEGGQTPAGALTAFARAEDRSRAFGAGFQRHVAKPVDGAGGCGEGLNARS